MPFDSTRPSVHHLSVLWGGTVLDVVTVHPGPPTDHLLRSGARLRAWLDEDDALQVSLDGGAPQEVTPGIRCDLSGRDTMGGVALLAAVDTPSPRLRMLLGIDSRYFHAVMICAAVQICVVSAFLLTPDRTPDREPGGGIRLTSFTRFINLSGGTGPTKGETFAAAGRTPDEAERIVEVARAHGKARGSSRGAAKGPTLQEAIDAIRRAIHRGDEGTDLRETLGDLAQATASAPELGAGFGGLMPRLMVEAGSGSGLIGLGESQLDQLLLRRREAVERSIAISRLRERREPGPKPIGPVSVTEVPHADVTMLTRSESPAVLDPVVRDHLTKAVRGRQNSIRYCYESFGLAANPHRTGRLVLEITLQPDGRVTEPVVTVSEPALQPVAECARKMAQDWYLGDGLVEEPVRLSFPFFLQPRSAPSDGVRVDEDGAEVDVAR